MKTIKLKASDSVHRDIARLFIGQKIYFPSGEPSKLIGVSDNFIINPHLDNISVMNFDEITIPLDSPMELRMALGTSIKLECKGWFDREGWIEVSCDTDLFYIVKFNKTAETKIETRLSIPWLKSIGVEIGE